MKLVQNALFTNCSFSNLWDIEFSLHEDCVNWIKFTHTRYCFCYGTATSRAKYQARLILLRFGYVMVQYRKNAHTRYVYC